ncbi:hypothetical protein BKA70DRAFT_345386 [Coprinopsis sp. MPI-PUGE-AT-0042]|nr:hypothetical protein BKA70DRAFT_345386 [Coprinopsis sp. MPI-PUGE-AT-0042]
MLSFDHPRRSPFIRLLQFTPSDLDTGAVKPLLGQLAEMALTEAGMGQRICAESAALALISSPKNRQSSSDSHQSCTRTLSYQSHQWPLVDRPLLSVSKPLRAVPTHLGEAQLICEYAGSCEKNIIPPFSCLKPARSSKGTMSSNAQTTPQRTCSG